MRSPRRTLYGARRSAGDPRSTGAHARARHHPLGCFAGDSYGPGPETSLAHRHRELVADRRHDQRVDRPGEHLRRLFVVGDLRLPPLESPFGGCQAPPGRAFALHRRERRPLARDFAGDAFVERLELGDGDALFFDGRLWHGSFDTDPTAARTALLLQYARADTPVRMPDFASLEMWPFPLAHCAAAAVRRRTGPQAAPRSTASCRRRAPRGMQPKRACRD